MTSEAEKTTLSSNSSLIKKPPALVLSPTSSEPLPKPITYQEFMCRVALARQRCDQIADSNDNIQFFSTVGSLPPKTAYIDPQTDLDLEIVVKTSVNSMYVQTITKIIQRILDKIHLEVFSFTLNELKRGLLSSPQVGSIDYLTYLLMNIEGQDTHGLSREWQSSSLPWIAIASTRRIFSDEAHPQFAQRQKQLMDITFEALEHNIHLTSEGAVELAHKYIAEFWQVYRDQWNDLPTVDYALRMAKFMSRLLLTFYVASLEVDELQSAKVKLFFNTYNARDLGQSNDWAVTSLIVDVEKPPWLDDHYIALLKQGAAIRNGDGESITKIQSDVDQRKQFCTEAESLIVNFASQIGTVVRRDQVTDRPDCLVSMAIEVLLGHIAKGQEASLAQPGKTVLEPTTDAHVPLVKTERHQAGKRIIAKGETGDECYFSPPGSGVSFAIYMEPGQAQPDYRKPGGLVGEGAVLLGWPRSADVFLEIQPQGQNGGAGAEREAEIMVIQGQLLRELFVSQDIKAAIENPALAEDDLVLLNRSRLAKFLLNYFTYEFIDYLGNLALRRPQQHATVETAADILQDNPLALYFVPHYADEVAKMFQENQLKVDEVQLAGGQPLFARGEDSGGVFYIVKDGSICISDFPTKPDLEVTITENAVFAEAALTRDKRSAAATAGEKGATLLKVPAKIFEQLCAKRKYRNLLWHIGVNAVGRLRRSYA